MLSDFQRWLIRSSARSMRKEIGGQVRRTLGVRTDQGNVWDVATTEIPPEVGESPECQWCPICRAARAMRESNPSLSDHLSTAGDVVASAVQEALKAFDSVLARSGGAARSWADGTDGQAESPDDWSAARDKWASEHGARIPDHGAQAARPGTGSAAPGHPAAPAVRAEPTGQDMTDEPDGSDEPDDRG
jgi:hypothetical protein